jgi:hypothetical protein
MGPIVNLINQLGQFQLQKYVTTEALLASLMGVPQRG